MLDDFLHSLCRYLVAQAAALTPAVPIAYATGTADQLFRWEATESSADTLYSVLVIYGGSPDFLRAKPSISLQVSTYGQSNKALAARADVLFAALTAADGSPLRMQSIPGYKAADNSSNGHWLIVNADWKQRPGLIGRDDRGRAKWVFNFEIGIEKTS
jgi:hypothetical protein